MTTPTTAALKSVRPGPVYAAFFIAVGAGHLLGRDSVQELLASRGVEVTRLN